MRSDPHVWDGITRRCSRRAARDDLACPEVVLAPLAAERQDVRPVLFAIKHKLTFVAYRLHFADARRGYR